MSWRPQTPCAPRIPSADAKQSDERPVRQRSAQAGRSSWVTAETLAVAPRWSRPSPMISPLSRTLRGALLALVLMAPGPSPPHRRRRRSRCRRRRRVRRRHRARRRALGPSGMRRPGHDQLGAPRRPHERRVALGRVPRRRPSTYLRCTIAFSLDVRWDWPKFCTITEHEPGPPHRPRPRRRRRDLMSPYYFDAHPSAEGAGARGRHAAAVARRAAAHSAAQTRRAHDRARRGR